MRSAPGVVGVERVALLEQALEAALERVQALEAALERVQALEIYTRAWDASQPLHELKRLQKALALPKKQD
jgi:hypothetical protein